MQDWMFEASADPFLWPEPQPYGQDGPLWFAPKPGGEDDWLAPLSTSSELPPIDVPPPPPRHGGVYNPDDYGGWDGHDTSQSQPPPDPEELPACVSAQPANVDEDALMRIVQHLTDELMGVFNDVPGNIDIDSSSYEYSVLIYEFNGTYGYGNINTNNSSDHVNAVTNGVPDGARIIAWMHSHPDNSIDVGVPSRHPGGDWDEYRDLVNQGSLSRGITVDPNLLLVLYSSDDEKTRIYDKNDRTATTPSCAI